MEENTKVYDINNERDRDNITHGIAISLGIPSSEGPWNIAQCAAIVAHLSTEHIKLDLEWASHEEPFTEAYHMALVGELFQRDVLSDESETKG